MDGGVAYCMGGSVVYCVGVRTYPTMTLESQSSPRKAYSAPRNTYLTHPKSQTVLNHALSYRLPPSSHLEYLLSNVSKTEGF